MPAAVDLGIANDGKRPGHEQAAQIAVALFAEMLSIVNARGIVPLSTNSKNFVLPIPRYATASSARKPRGLIKWSYLL
jgi:hypothetical protein